MSTASVKIVAAGLLSLVFCGIAVAAPKHPSAPVKVGLIFDLTGKREPALDVVKGIEVAASELREAGLNIELVKYNSESNAAGTRSAVQDLLKDPPDVVIAEVDSSKAVIAAEMMESAKRVMMTPYATSPLVTKDRKFVFRACFSDDFQGAKLATFALKNAHAKRVAIFSDGGELYSQTLAKTFREQFEKDGGEIVHDEKILSSASSFKDQIDAAIKLKADLIFLPVYEQTAARFINEALARIDQKIVFLGGDGWGASRTFKDVVFRKSSPVEAYWVSHYSGDFKEPLVKAAAENFRKVKGEELNASSAIGYDSMMVVGKILLTNKGKNPTQEELANALRSMTPYRGLTGTIRYDHGQDPKKSLFVRKVDQDKMGFVTEISP